MSKRKRWRQARANRKNRIAVWTVVITIGVGLIVITILFLRSHHNEEHHEEGAAQRNPNAPAIRAGD